MAAETIAVESNYGRRYIQWLQPGRILPKAYAGLFLSICCGCGKEQGTQSAYPRNSFTTSELGSLRTVSSFGISSR